MKNKLFWVTAVFGVVIILLTGFIYFCVPIQDNQNNKSQQIVALNEINQLINSGDTTLAQEKILMLENSIRNTENTTQNNYQIILVGGVSLAFLIVVSLYFHFAVLRPFNTLKDFANSVAKGNFDIPLKYERSNYFGKFTWAFDSMRNEIIKARQCEKDAIENNKTVIATLSHDIKTPIASIKAYVEGLQANMDSTPAKREKYISVLLRKCDEVSRLTDDLFLHSISNLDKIKINSEKFELCSFMEMVISEIASEQNDIKFNKPDFKVFVKADNKRLTQIIENLINNSRKYAKTNIDVNITQSNGYAHISFIDYGNGIPDSDMPFIFGKFYRGKNVEQEEGSGLGLYIVKHLVEKMDGKILLHNHINNFEAILSLPITNS